MEFPNKGSLHISTIRKSENSPDLWGSIKIEPEYLKDLLAKSNGLVEVKLSGWHREAKTTGNKFISLSVDTYVKPTQKEEKLPYE
jgi:hypothetical protein